MREVTNPLSCNRIGDSRLRLEIPLPDVNLGDSSDSPSNS
jgi:hypothetical protein